MPETPESTAELDVAPVTDAPALPQLVDRVTDFDAFVAARGEALLRMATLLTGDPGRADELVRSALGRAYLRWTRLRRGDDPEAYIRRHVVRQHLLRLRLAPSRRMVVLSDRATTSTPERETTWALLARLPRRQRAVLVLRCSAEMSDEQIARTLGCRVRTVRVDAERALARLDEAVRP